MASELQKSCFFFYEWAPWEKRWWTAMVKEYHIGYED